MKVNEDAMPETEAGKDLVAVGVELQWANQILTANTLRQMIVLIEREAYELGRDRQYEDDYPTQGRRRR